MSDSRTTELREKLEEDVRRLSRGWSDDDEQEKRLRTEVEELLDRQAAIIERECLERAAKSDWLGQHLHAVMAENRELQDKLDELNAELGNEINGDTSDGYHTFNELYHHRAVLFSVIVRDHRELAWKARKHHDGTMYDGMFIVGIETPKGQATYHYDLDPYWEMFDCEERESAPEWDGHTPDEAIARIAELGSGTCKFVSSKSSDYPPVCSACGYELGIYDCEWFEDGTYGYERNYCPNCGKAVER